MIKLGAIKTKNTMQILKTTDLNAPNALPTLQFKSTVELAQNEAQHCWVAQTEAQKAATFGLQIPQNGFHLLVLGTQGSGRTSLMLSAMQTAAQLAKPQLQEPQLQDIVALHHFEQPNQPNLVKLPVGVGASLRLQMDLFARDLMVQLPIIVAHKTQVEILAQAETWLLPSLTQHLETVLSAVSEAQKTLLNQYIKLASQEVLGFLKVWQPGTPSEGESANEALLDGLINETLFARLRVNVLVDNRATLTNALHQAVIYDNDPSLQSLFGGVENATDSNTNPEFLRLKAGNLHKADGGMLMLHLRDLLCDENNGVQMIEKLHRFLRNGTLQIEDSGGGAQGNSISTINSLVPLKVKLVMIATREDFFDCLDQNPDFFEYFPIKVEFAESIGANAENYAAIAGFVAYKVAQHGCAHFSADAVASLINAMQRLEEDQHRISASFAHLERLMLESAAFAGSAILVTTQHVQQALQARAMRHRYFENQIRDSIIDNELLIEVQGDVIGQVNGLTHIELGDASFGSPIRITARCYPGRKGLINIDREVNMSGPNHDKGIFILQNWLSASFSHLAPLSLNASLVFEQEYNGVEGDSASCAELFALLSALAGAPIRQGIAVTGALNQFGEVMPVGGINEKIEGYFRVCQAMGLDGKQGVMIPKRNQRHLLLDADVIAAVEAGQFTIITIDHVLEGIAFLTQQSAEQIMAHADATLASYRKTLELNQQVTDKSTT